MKAVRRWHGGSTEGGWNRVGWSLTLTLTLTLTLILSRHLHALQRGRWQLDDVRLARLRQA